MKIGYKIILDIILIVIIATLFSKNVISLTYHEVVGLIIGLLFILHLIFNRKAIFGILAGKTIRGKIMFCTNIVLIISWIAVIVTGILVSKKLFSFNVSSLIPWHFFASAVALIITGIHFGLHRDYFRGFLNRKLHINKYVLIGLTIIIFCFGGYSIFNSNFTQWISAPFNGSGAEHHREMMQANTIEGNYGGETGEIAERSHGGEHGQQEFNLSNFLLLIAKDFSIFFFFASLVYGIDLLQRKAHK